VVRRAASVETHSEHPIARGVVRSAEERGSPSSRSRASRRAPGSASRERPTAGGSGCQPGYLAERGIETGDERVGALQRQGKTVVFLLEDDRLTGALALAISSGLSRGGCPAAQSDGYPVHDAHRRQPGVAAWVAGELGLDEFFAGVLPHEKAAKIQEVQRRYRVAMVGDGSTTPGARAGRPRVAIGAGPMWPWRAPILSSCETTPETQRQSSTSQRRPTGRCSRTSSGDRLQRRRHPARRRRALWCRYRPHPAAGAVLMSASTVIVAVNARMLRV